MRLSTSVVSLFVVLGTIANVLAKKSLLVETTNGPVQGHETFWKDGSVVKSWQGIPYAKPPVGDLRWRSPESPDSWTDILETTSLQSQCVQNYGEGVEDCLYLNVYVTGNPTNEGPYPVLFYIYGGSLMSGAANAEFGGFVSHVGGGEGVVVVEVSYRLNIIGFLAAAELSEEQGGVSGNYGIQDQIFALKWVQANIAKFNGNPNLVTISGQSSGGTSVFSILSSPSSVGLFHRAISLSGSPNITISMSAAEKQNAHLIDESGCKTSEDATSVEVMRCLRSKSTDELVKLIPLAWSTPGLFGLPLSVNGEGWEGLVIVDGITIPYAFDDALAYGNVSSNVPFMIGAMGQENDWGPEKDVQYMDADKWQQYLIEYFAPWDTKLRNEGNNNNKALNKKNVTQVQTVGDAIYQLYLNEVTVDANGNPQKAYDSITSDYGQSCANVAIAKHALTSAYKAPIYHFVNQYHLSTALGGPRPQYTVNYAFHTLDYSMVRETWSDFDTNDQEYVPDQRDLEGAQLIQSLWYSFMVTGNPTAGVSNVYPGDIPEWKSFSDTADWPASYNTYVIQSDSEWGATTGTVNNYQSAKCDYFEQIGISRKEFWWCN